MLLITESSTYADIHDNELNIPNCGIYLADRNIDTNNYAVKGGGLIALKIFTLSNNSLLVLGHRCPLDTFSEVKVGLSGTELPHKIMPYATLDCL